MKFIADVMLGKLAKRMRLLGYDVLYDHTLDDNEIIQRALEQDRVILTRDTGLANRPLAANSHFIDNDDPEEQLKEIMVHFNRPRVQHVLTRCSLCNEILTPLSRQDAKNLVPDYVYTKYSGFFQCKKCEKIYWEGSHLKRMSLDK